MSRKKTRSNRRLTTNRATAIGSTRPGSRNATSYGVKKSTTTSRMVPSAAPSDQFNVFLMWSAIRLEISRPSLPRTRAGVM